MPFSCYNEVFLKNQMSLGIYCHSDYIYNVMGGGISEVSLIIAFQCIANGQC